MKTFELSSSELLVPTARLRDDYDRERTRVQCYANHEEDLTTWRATRVCDRKTSES